MFLLLTLTNLLGQNIKDNYFLYEVTISKDLKEKSNKYVEYDSSFLEYELLYNNNQTIFKPIFKLNNSQTGTLKYSNIFMKSQGEYFIDDDLKLTQNNKIFQGKSFIINKRFDEFNWLITDETELINNIICKKAILLKNEKDMKGNREYKITVWYNDNFQNDIAPFGLAGLKGIIMKINFNNTSEVNFKSSKQVNLKSKVKTFTDGTIVTDKEYNNLIEEKLKDVRTRTSIN